MARKIRIEYAGAGYHATNRGNYRHDLFITAKARFEVAGADRVAVRQARAERWEDKLRTIAEARAINLAELPRKKSAPEKLTLAAAMKDAKPVSLGWLAQRLPRRATDRVASLLTRFRARGRAFNARNSGSRT